MIRDADYAAWMTQTKLARRPHYSPIPEPGLLSFVTSAYNTPPEFLEKLVDSVLSQDFGLGHTFDWVIVDNGSTLDATKSCIAGLDNRTFVKVVRLSENLGILGGLRAAVRSATGRYILPLDSDDYLYPDCARIVSHFIQVNGYPALLYSDEDKVEGADFFLPYLKPDWDPVLFVNSCYIAHLCAIDRGLATILGAYEDDRVRGCHDWDTFMRFYATGYTPTHIPEVLYSWRVHDASCSGNIDSKDYIHESHRACLSRFISMQSHPEKYELDYSPLFNRTPDWWIKRQPLSGRSMIDVHLQGPNDPVESAAAYLIPEKATASELRLVLGRERRMERKLVHFVRCDCSPASDTWLLEAQAIFELFPDAVAVGGPLYDQAGEVIAAGIYFGFGNGVDSPDCGRGRHDPGYFAQMWKQHSVSAVRMHHAVVDGAFLLDALISGRIAPEAPLSLLGEWIGATALRWGKRVVYSPFLAAEASSRYRDTHSAGDLLEFLRVNLALFPDHRFYSQYLDLRREHAYRPATREERARHMEDLAGRVADRHLPDQTNEVLAAGTAEGLR